MEPLHPIVESFGKAVERTRTRKKISQEKLAAMAGVHRTHIGKIESGQIACGIDTAKQIADALGVSLAWLVRQAEKVLK